jgi:5-methyltetrahydrofolate--homocysteine methyltransferase
METELQVLYTSVLEGNMKTIAGEVQVALDRGFHAGQILNTALIPALTEVGRLFEEGEVYIPEMLISAKTMQNAVAVIRPLLMDVGIRSAGKVVIGTVQGDLHDIGKNLVAMMLEGAGFEIVDLGTDVPTDRFMEAIEAHQPDLVALSALLTTTLPSMEKTVNAITAAGLRPNVSIMVGGAPVTEAYATSIGADGYATDASRAVTLAKNLMEKKLQSAG